jgi:surface polysaccharide O-acyltransferase-like enzyme
MARLGRLAAVADGRPVGFFMVLAALSTLAYVPLAIAYTPWTWADYGPMSFQVSRPLHYFVYFAAGVALGARGIDSGLLATEGVLARHWTAWLVAAIAGFILWALPTSITLEQGAGSPLTLQFAAALGYVIACPAGCLCLTALCLRFLRERTAALDTLSANAYGMYLVHYGFAVWLQYALLDAPLFAVVKAALVFGATLALSLVVTSAWNRLSFGTQSVPAEREPRRA